jgi:hypothetical protein
VRIRITTKLVVGGTDYLKTAEIASIPISLKFKISVLENRVNLGLGQRNIENTLCTLKERIIFLAKLASPFCSFGSG